MRLTEDARNKLIAIERIVGKESAEAFVNVMKNSSTGDRLARVLQFIIDAKFDDDVLHGWVACMVDPSWGIANATDDEIKGLAHMIRGMVEGARRRAARPEPAKPKPRQPEPQQGRMQRPELVTHLASKCGISHDAVDAVLAELAALSISETNARNTFEIPGIGTIVKRFSKERMGRNPETGEEILIRAKTQVRFHVDETVKGLCGAEESNVGKTIKQRERVAISSAKADPFARL